MGYSISNHRLKKDGAAVPWKESPNHGGKLKPRFLIMHYTAGTSASGAISWLTNPKAKASAHLVIDRNGAVTQLVGFDTVAWHAGKSSWNGLVGLNSWSIGIELVNAGKLWKKGGGKWVNWAGNVVSEDDLIEATHKHETSPAGWQIYPEPQLAAAIEIGRALHDAYDFDEVLGHEDISPKNKIDTGPAFPMISFVARVMGGA
ncbi:N-acetylmuramoyl-L-alanine amidase [Segnochrobactraceae bacterium EtOH-i3]